MSKFTIISNFARHFFNFLHSFVIHTKCCFCFSTKVFHTFHRVFHSFSGKDMPILWEIPHFHRSFPHFYPQAVENLSTPSYSAKRSKIGNFFPFFAMSMVKMTIFPKFRFIYFLFIFCCLTARHISKQARRTCV